MQDENEDVQDEVVVQEEESTTEDVTTEETQESEEDTIVLKKSDYTKLNRKAKAYDANKGKTQPRQEASKDPQGNFIETVFMVKDLNQTEYDTLRDEANDLGIPFEKYVSSNSGKTILNKLRADKKSKDSSEALTSKSPVFKKHTAEDLGKMSSKELEKILPHN